MCGIIGIYNYEEEVSSAIFKGLKALQHRGNDSAGIATFKDRFFIYKKSGKLTEIFTQEILDSLKGKSGIGHVRYATQGKNNDEEAQPFFISYPFGITMAHNGNITNRKEIQKRLENNFFSIKKTNDIELILFTFADELKKLNLPDIRTKDIFAALENTQKILKGAYSVISLIGNIGMLAFKDKLGIRPLVFAEKKLKNGKTSYGFASETIALTKLGYRIIRELKPNEAVFIDKNGKIHTKIFKTENKERMCIFEYIYFSKPESHINNLSIAKEREKYGNLLAGAIKKDNLDIDFVTEIPQTAYFSAIALSQNLNLPYKKVIIKNNTQRYFIQNNKQKRKITLKEKFTIIKEFVKNKKILLVDDSIVRGSTAKFITEQLKKAGAQKIYMVSASPMIKYPCVYGIDMSITKELLAYNKSKDEIKNILNVDKLYYMELSDLKNIYQNNYNFCDACFSGNYPTGITQKEIEYMEKERIKIKNNLKT